MKRQKSILEIESELYSLVKTLTKVHNKYRLGEIQENFYLKSIKTSIRDLIQFNFDLQDKNVQLQDFLKKMDISDDYDMIINIINNVANLKANPKGEHLVESRNATQKIQQAVLQLPGLSTEITTAFITLMDALKLGDIASGKLLKKLFSDLLTSLYKFPGLENVANSIENLSKQISGLEDNEIQNNHEQDALAEEIYSVFNEFKNKLNL